MNLSRLIIPKLERFCTPKYTILRPFSGALISNNFNLQNATHVPYRQQHRNVTSAKSFERESIITKIKNRFNLKVATLRLKGAGYFLYERVADKINYSEFFEEFCLPDTFYSWFVVTELHMWMLMVRCMAEEGGRVVRNGMVEALWSDVGLRIKKVGPVGATKDKVNELSEQFQAALLAYDEGLQSDDMVLAAAVWRRMYQKSNIDPEYLDDMVKYIRRQTRLLETLSKDDLFVKKSVTWQPLGEKMS